MDSGLQIETIHPEKTTPPNFGNRISRSLFALCWLVFARFTPAPLHAWRRTLLRLFGAKIGAGASVYSDVTIWAPWNLTMEDGACLGPGARCYNVANVVLKRDCVVSQRAYLCTAGHDVRERDFPLVSAPIIIGEGAWVAAEAFIGPGVQLHDGSVVAARGVCTKSVEKWDIVAGNPAKKVGERKWRDAP